MPFLRRTLPGVRAGLGLGVAVGRGVRRGRGVTDGPGGGRTDGDGDGAGTALDVLEASGQQGSTLVPGEAPGPWEAVGPGGPLGS